MTTALLDRKQRAVQLDDRRWTFVEESTQTLDAPVWRTIEPLQVPPAARLTALRLQAEERMAGYEWTEETVEEQEETRATVSALRPLQARTIERDC